jgi:DNA-binding transcriptional ArsR family regulator
MMSSNQKREYDEEILDCLRNYSFGLTITDIADKIDTTRNTIYRYLALLEGKNLVFKKKVGRYVLYFSKDKRIEFLNDIAPVYKSLIKSIQKEFGNQFDAYKRIGEGLVEILTLPVHTEGFEQLESLQNLSNKELFELIKNIFPYLSIFDNKVNVRIIEISKDNSKVVYQIYNSNLLESENYLIHFHILAGYLQQELRTILKKDVACHVSKYEIFSKKKDSYLNLSLELD